MALVIQLNEQTIEDEAVARAIVEFIDALPALEPARYDLNQRENWRGWEIERATVDLLTQRTQLFRVEGEGGNVMVATGKHGEVPTIAIDGRAGEGVDEALYAPLRPRSAQVVRADGDTD